MNKIETLALDEEESTIPLENEEGVVVPHRVVDVVTVPETRKNYVILAPVNQKEGDKLLAARVRIVDEQLGTVELSPVEDNEELSQVRDAYMELLTDQLINVLDETVETEADEEVTSK